MKKRIIAGFILLVMGLFVAFSGLPETSVQAAAAAAPTTDVRAGSKSEIDVTYKDDAYVTIRSTIQNAKRLKVKIEKGSQSYTYDLNGKGTAEVYSLQMGNGQYTIKVLENISGTRYAAIQTITINVTYTNANAPYLIPTQNVNYSSSSTTVSKAQELMKGKSDTLSKVQEVYKFIVQNIVYDTAKANQVTSGQITTYIPNVDNVLSSKKGICFDYSSLMAAMLRSQGIPTKLVMGYVAPDNVYHAWNEVYIENVGWIKINGSIYFDGKTYSRMDSTFAASNTSGKQDAYLSNDNNYKTTLVY